MFAFIKEEKKEEASCPPMGTKRNEEDWLKNCS